MRCSGCIVALLSVGCSSNPSAEGATDSTTETGEGTGNGDCQVEPGACVDVAGECPLVSFDVANGSDRPVVLGGEEVTLALHRGPGAQGSWTWWRQLDTSPTPVSVAMDPNALYWGASAAADLDADGVDGLLLAGIDGSVLLFEVNDDAMGLTQSAMLGHSGADGAVGTGDFDGDGNDDVLVIDYAPTEGVAAVLVGPTFTGGEPIVTSLPGGSAPPQADLLAIGDFDADQRLDFAYRMYSAGRSAEAMVAFGNGDGTFEPPEEVGDGGTGPGLLALARETGGDLLVLPQRETLHVYRAQARGDWQRDDHVLPWGPVVSEAQPGGDPVSVRPPGMVVEGDWLGDDRTDVVVVEQQRPWKCGDQLSIVMVHVFERTGDTSLRLDSSSVVAADALVYSSTYGDIWPRAFPEGRLYIQSRMAAQFFDVMP